MKKLVYEFSSIKTDGNYNMKFLVGSKGANLADMCSIGINVPPGCTIITDVSIDYINNNYQISEELFNQVINAIRNIEEITGNKFGDPNNPLLLSIR
ncbi:MAG: pyruvate, phosphate dikinase, partial [Sphingobacteriaceae bacterium]